MTHGTEASTQPWDRRRADVVAIGRLMFDGTGGPGVENRAVLIAGTRILGVEPWDDHWRAPVGAQVIGGTEAAIVPGLVDAHVHLCGIDARHVDPRTTARAIDQAQRAMAAGVTTIRDCGGPGHLTIELKQAQEAGLWAGPRIVACGSPLTTTAGHCHWMGGRADTAEALRIHVRQIRQAGGDFIKIMLTGGMSTPGSNPYQAQYSIEEIAPVVDDAHRLGMTVAAHVLSNAGIRVAVASGVDTIEHGWSITGAMQDFTPEAADLVAAADHRVIASLTAHRDLRSLVRDPAGREELLSRVAPHRALAERGVPLVVHSDADGKHTPLDEFGYSVEVYRQGLDTTFEAALHAATGLAAEAVGLAGVVGEITPGCAADILVLAGDPREDPTYLHTPTHVIANGQPFQPSRAPEADDGR